MSACGGGGGGKGTLPATPSNNANGTTSLASPVISEIPIPGEPTADSNGIAIGGDGAVYFRPHQTFAAEAGTWAGRYLGGTFTFTAPFDFGCDGNDGCAIDPGGDNIVVDNLGTVLWDATYGLVGIGAQSGFVQVGAGGGVAAKATSFRGGRSPSDMAVDGANNLWIASVRSDGVDSGQVEIVDPTRTTSHVVLDTSRHDFYYDTTIGPDGNLWVTQLVPDLVPLALQIIDVNPSGTVLHTFDIASVASFGEIGQQPFGLTLGPDGKIWFTDPTTSKIGRLNADGTFTEFAPPTPGSLPARIVTGPDGALWFTEYAASKIGRITTSGSISEFPLSSNAHPFGIAAPPPGCGLNTMWFREQGGLGKIAF